MSNKEKQKELPAGEHFKKEIVKVPAVLLLVPILPFLIPLQLFRCFIPGNGLFWPATLGNLSKGATWCASKLEPDK